MLNNREIASLILMGAVLIVVLAVPKVRRPVLSAAADVLRAARSPKILAVFGLFLVWCGAWIFVGWRVGLWQVELVKESVLIVLTVGFPVLFTTIRAKSGTAILRKIVGETAALSALLAFYINLEPFPLPVELVLQLALLVIVPTRVVAGTMPNATAVRGCLDVLLVAIGSMILIWTTVRLVVTANERDWTATWMELALSVWLPLSMFGYFYGVAFFAYVETANLRMRRFFQPPASKRVMVAMVLGLHLRVRWAAAFTGPFQNEVSRSTSFREALTAMRAFRQEVLHREAREQERQARLTVMAGELGTDGDGAQLDRREFEGTKRALRDMIHTAQEMRYERLGNRYWDDLTEEVILPASRYGLPDSHGILVEVTADHQRWRAWRRLPNGWVLGVGGKDGSRREFLYSGAEPPTTWPGAPDWADTAVSLHLPTDWEQDDSPVK